MRGMPANPNEENIKGCMLVPLIDYINHLPTPRELRSPDNNGGITYVSEPVPGVAFVADRNFKKG